MFSFVARNGFIAYYIQLQKGNKAPNIIIHFDVYHEKQPENKLKLCLLFKWNTFLKGILTWHKKGNIGVKKIFFYKKPMQKIK